MEEIEKLENFEVFIKYLSKEKTSRLKKILFNFEYLKLKTKLKGANSLIFDFDYLPDDEDVQNLQKAIRLCSQIVKNNPIQLASQLIGRLKSYEKSSKPIQYLLNSISFSKPWLKPRFGKLISPASSLDITIKTEWESLHFRKGRELFSSDSISEPYLLPDKTVLIARYFDAEIVHVDTKEGLVKEKVQHPLNTRLSFFSVIHGTYTMILGYLYKSPDLPEQDLYKIVLKRIDDKQVLWEKDFPYLIRSAFFSKESNDLFVISGNELIVQNTTDNIVQYQQIIEIQDYEAVHFFKTNNNVLYFSGSLALETRPQSNLSISKRITIASSITHEGQKYINPDVRKVFISPYEYNIAYASNDNEFLKIDLSTGWVQKESNQYEGDPVLFLSRKELLCIRENTFCVWDVLKNEPIQEIETTEIIEFAIKLDKNKVLSVHRNGELKIWDVAHFRGQDSRAKHKGEITILKQLPSSDFVFTMGKDNQILKHRISTGEVIMNFPGLTDTVVDFNFSHDKESALSITKDGNLIYWNFETPNASFSFNLEREGFMCAFGFNKKQILSVANEFIDIWNPFTRKIVRSLTNHRNRQTKYLAYFLPDGEHILVTHDFPVIDMYNLTNGSLVKQFSVIHKDKNDVFRKIESTSDGKAVLVQLKNNLYLINLENEEQTNLGKEYYSVNDFIVFPNQQKVVLKNDNILLWDIDKGEVLRTFLGSTKDNLRSVSHNGQYFVSVKNNILNIWDTENETVLRSFESDFEITSTCFTDNLSQLMFGDSNGEIHYLSLENFETNTPSTVTATKIESSFYIECPWCHSGIKQARLNEMDVLKIQRDKLGEKIFCNECNKPLQVNSFFHNWDYPFDKPKLDSVFLTKQEKQKSSPKGFFNKQFGTSNKSLSKRLRKNVQDIVFLFEKRIGIKQTSLLQKALQEGWMKSIDDLEGAKKAALNHTYQSLPSLAIALSKMFHNHFFPDELENINDFLPFSESPLVFAKWAKTYLATNQKTEQIMTALMKALEIDPDYFEALLAYAELWNKPYLTNNFTGKSILFQTEELCPDNHYSWRNIGKQWEVCEEFQFAVNAYDKASKFTDAETKIDYWIKIADLLNSKLQLYEEAEKYYDMIEKARK